MRHLIIPILLATATFTTTACDRVRVSETISVSKVSRANFDQIRTGMSKKQVETILGQPTSIDTKDILLYKRTTYRYEDGPKFIQITFKNDELDGKDTNL